jgi:hypothetical protein
MGGRVVRRHAPERAAERDGIMKSFLAVILCTAPAMWAADLVPLDVKPGQWEATVTMQMPGMAQQAGKMPPLTPEQLAKIPPEQRAKIEAMFAGKPTTTTSRTCMQKQDLTKMPMGVDQSCKNVVVTSTGAKQVMRQECDRGGRKTVGTVTIEAVSSESVKFSIVSEGGDDKTNGMNIQGTSKWLGPVCTDNKK